MGVDGEDISFSISQIKAAYSYRIVKAVRVEKYFETVHNNIVDEVVIGQTSTGSRMEMGKIRIGNKAVVGVSASIKIIDEMQYRNQMQTGQTNAISMNSRIATNKLEQRAMNQGRILGDEALKVPRGMMDKFTYIRDTVEIFVAAKGTSFPRVVATLVSTKAIGFICLLTDRKVSYRLSNKSNVTQLVFDRKSMHLLEDYAA